MNRFVNILCCLLLSLGAWAQTDSIAAPADTLTVDSLATDTLATDSVAKFNPYAVPDSLVVTDSTAMQPTEAPDGPAPEIEYSVSRQTYEIAGIKVTGAENYEDFVIIGFSGLAVGDKVDIPGDQITKALKRFWKQGLFSDVKIKATKIQDKKIWLEIALKQRPRVSEIAYNGLKKSEREDLEVKVGISKGSQMTPNLSDRAKKVIKKYLAEKGFHNAKVQVLEFDDLDKPGYVKVAINVDRQVKTKVGKIYITGNEALTHTQINRAMKKTNDNHITNLFRTKKFVTEEFEKDKKAVIEKYNEVGYRDAYIVADSVVPNPDDPTRVDIYMTISEGDKYYIRNISWIGNTVYPY